MLWAIALVAFLLNGEVWTIPPGGGEAVRVTSTGGLVENFRYSPDHAYLAYAKRIGAGEDDITSIMVVRTDNGTMLTDLESAGESMHIDRWLGRTLVYHASTPGEVSGVYEYDTVRRERREVDLSGTVSWSDRDASVDGTLTVYVDDVGLGPTFRERLHLVDSTGADLVRASRRSVMAPDISPDGRAIAYVEVLDTTDVPARARDRVWVVRPDGTEVMIYDGPVRAKGGGLTWSPDGRYVAMNFSGRVFVLDANAPRPPVLEQSGNAACWVDEDHLAIARPGLGIDVLELPSGAGRHLVAEGSRPQCVDAISRPGTTRPR